MQDKYLGGLIIITEKKHTSKAEQLKELKKRNMDIHENSPDYGVKILTRNNYYNLINGYKSPFLEDKYKSGTSLKEIYSLYKFDKNISKLFFGYLLTIESLIKTVISDKFSDKYGHKNYLKKENFNYTSDFDNLSQLKKSDALKKNNKIIKLIDKLNRYVENDSHAKPYIIHYKNKHQYIPLWVLVNVLTFGDIVKFYKLMKQSERDKVANVLSINKRINSKDLDNFLSLLEDFRNKSAHDQRFYTIQTKNTKGIRYTLKFNDISYQGKPITHFHTSLFTLILTIKVLLEKDEFCLFFNDFITEITKLKRELNTINISYILNQMDFMSNDLDLSNIEKIKRFFQGIF